MIKSDKIILGLDPGTNIMGYGIIKSEKLKLRLVQYGDINLKKYTDHGEKLKLIFDKVNELIDEYKPDEISIEAPFYGKNVQSMLKLGRAQGVAIVAALNKGIPIIEYAPKKIKQSVTGNGNATKDQLSEMVMKTLNFKKNNSIKNYDATDALGAAICHFYQKSSNKNTKKSWKQYVEINSDKIIK
jgi:crossover junction endodeoxyribonuclease RuvC|tara:strand:- start:1948 stop:2505 length:558 start_codon:yes stop_codon:yes gene_type:complete